MSLDEMPLVGNADARSIHGRSSGGSLIVLGDAVASSWSERAQPFDLKMRGERVSLATAASIAAEDTSAPLVLVASDLELSPVALLDVLDGPGDSTAALVLDAAATIARPPDAAMVRVAPHGRDVTSVGTPAHVVSRPTGYVAGVLRVRGKDRVRVAEALRLAAATPAASDPRVHPFDLALLAVVRSGIPVGAVTLGPYTFHRGELAGEGAPGSAWQQRLRGASRGSDGPFSTAVVRPLSRRLTAVGLGHGWTPNTVTAVSLFLGLAASAAAVTGDRWAWLAAAVLLQLSLVVDCVDGEIARFTRRHSPLGGWLDAVSDRVKEFSMVAAVAWVSARRGEDLWWLALIVLGILAVRHVEDFAYTSRARALVGAPAHPDVFRPSDLGLASAPIRPASPTTDRDAALRAVKQVLHLPIAERYLIMSVALVAHSPALFLWLLGGASLLALAYTQSGRLVKALMRRDGFSSDLPDPHLGSLTDLALLPRPAGVAKLAWQVPGLLVATEVAVLLWASGGAGAQARSSAYAWLAAVSWHHYDTVYRIRETGRGPARWLTRATLGTDGRVLILGALGLLLENSVAALMGGAMVLGFLYAAESLAAWRPVMRDTAHVGRRQPASRAQDDSPSVQTGEEGS